MPCIYLRYRRGRSRCTRTSRRRASPGSAAYHRRRGRAAHRSGGGRWSWRARASWAGSSSCLVETAGRRCDRPGELDGQPGGLDRREGQRETVQVRDLVGDVETEALPRGVARAGRVAAEAALAEACELVGSDAGTVV